jgi:hypothetical protein
MPCYYPLHGYRSKHKEASGKRKIVFNPKYGIQDEQVSVPCGQCIGCRLERSKQWAIRCVHEASMYPDNSFITLTYNNENLPENENLQIEDFQKFMKRLRKKLGKVRYYMCGEYGYQRDENGEEITRTYIVNGKEKKIPIPGRPHFHACLFGLDFSDKELWTVRNGINLYRSPTLEKIWDKGFSSIGNVTFESAAYVARYIAKKITGEQENLTCLENGLKHYERQTDCGEIISINKEFTTMSRRPGIGNDWFKHYKDDVFQHDSVTLRGKEIKPPRYYFELYKDMDEIGYDQVKEKRRIQMLNNQSENDVDRLRAKETVKLAAIKTLKREL